MKHGRDQKPKQFEGFRAQSRVSNSVVHSILRDRLLPVASKCKHSTERSVRRQMGGEVTSVNPRKRGLTVIPTSRRPIEGFKTSCLIVKHRIIELRLTALRQESQAASASRHRTRTHPARSKNQSNASRRKCQSLLRNCVRRLRYHVAGGAC
jgi:hypothetical protein